MKTKLTQLYEERRLVPQFRLLHGRVFLGFWLSLGLALFSPGRAAGLGVRIPNQDADAIARGNAFVATADNPSAIYYNPAGITQLDGLDAQFGLLNYFGINTRYDSPAGNHVDTAFHVIPVPQLHVAYTPQELPLSFGLGVYAPFGLGTEWPDNSGFRSLAIEANLQYITVNPVAAWKITPNLSVGAGPTFNYSKLQIKRGLVTPTDVLDFDGTGVSYGFNGGVLWQPLDRWSIGANYRSASTLNYEGQTTYFPGVPLPAAPTSAKVNFPQIICGGVSFRPTPKWNFEVDVDWTDWENVKTITLNGTSAIFGSDLPLQLNWHGSWFYEVGATRSFDNGWYVSAGYFYSGESTSTANFTPAVPDTELHVGSVGFGHKGEHWHWALAAQIIAGPERVVSGSQPNPFTGQSADGKYQLFVPALTFSVGYHF